MTDRQRISKNASLFPNGGRIQEFCLEALELARRAGASYADVRVASRDSECLVLRTGKIEHLSRGESFGFGLRVIANGAWGFASSPAATPQEARRVAEEAVALARAASAVKSQEVVLAPVDAHKGSFSSDWQKDPFDVPLEEKIALLRQADEALRRNPKIKLTECSMEFWKHYRLFASTEGALIEQIGVESGAGIEATAIEGSEVQTRSYPASMGGDYASAGYEFVERLNLVDNAERVADEAVALLDAPVCPEGETTVIIEGSMLALQVHESCGHPIELDRVFGTESSFAGTSFLTPEKLGSFKYGSEIVNITADATLPGGLGSFAFDDEGVPAQCVDIVRNGVFCGYLTSRETAARMGWSSGGAMRADGWDRIPLIRMTNINLLPGQGSLDELIADTEEGLYVATVKSWSIDDKRLNFQFGQEAAWEVKNGRLGRMYKNPIYYGITPQFWNQCDAICGESEWRLWGVPNCGKGEPMQVAHVGHGVAPARFRNVRVGGAGK